MPKPHDGVLILELPQTSAVRRREDSGEIPQATMAPTRLRSILHRLHTDFYGKDEVLDRVADRVTRELR
jgi:hypothetical protein